MFSQLNRTPSRLKSLSLTLLPCHARPATYGIGPAHGSRLSGRRTVKGIFPSILATLVVSLAAFVVPCGNAQQIEPTPPLSQRSTINLSAGVPQYIGAAATNSNSPQSHWYYQDDRDSPAYSNPALNESTDTSVTWKQVGLPYDANIARTFLNQTSGGGQGSLKPVTWYRLHFKVDAKYAGQKFLLNLEGTHTGVQIFINGQLLPGVSQVAKDAQATHVVGFVPVIVDLTPYLKEDGTTDNVLAINVSAGSTWFEQPGFSGAFRFGQAMTGLFRNVFLYVTNPVHIPVNVYSNTKTWGTYVGTKSIAYDATATASADSAIVEVQTNVLNESSASQQVTLTTQIVDAGGKVVVTAPPVTQTISPMTPSTFPSTATPLFDQQITVPNPTLWYPNSSPFGKPYMYRVYHIVSVNGVVVDSTQSPLGIRMITWDSNFPYFNGHAQHLWGGSGRYDYPALGSSVPDEQVWRDVQQFAAAGGNIWRPGHSTSSEEFVAACDAFGVMIDQPSGDGEGNWGYGANGGPTADDLQLKQEIHRDMIIRDRSHPSILDWEEDNGGMNATLAAQLGALEETWDTIQVRKQATRSGTPAFAFINECDGAGCEIAAKGSNPDYPAFGAEYWNNIGTGRGLAWDNELAFAAPYLDDWRRSREANAFGIAQWYFADTPGEVSTWSEYQNAAAPPNAPTGFLWSNYVRSLGYSMVDQNRFPRLLYSIYEANWTPYTTKPMVALAHHWNRAYEAKPGTPLQENAFSNCPAVRLLVNGVAKDPVTGAVLVDQVPNAWNINTSTDLTQNSTVMPGQVHWMINYAPGTVTAECLDQSYNPVAGVVDSRTTAGAEYKIVLTAVPNVVRPDGTSFQWTSNGSDAAFVVATVVDQNGNIVPTAADNVTFAVSGPATYMGGTQQLVADPVVGYTDYQDAFSKLHANDINGLPYAFFHAPGDPELNFEGGLQKVALRSTFTPGNVTVTASSPGLVSGSVTLTSVVPPAPVATEAPAIIVPPVGESVTAGYAGTFTVSASGSGTLSYQWYLNKQAVAGATATSYTTQITTPQDNGDTISVTVSSAFGVVSSNAVTMSVSAPAKVAITAQPQSQTAVVGQSTTLTVAASGSPQLNFVWYENGVMVQSGPQPSYSTPIFAKAETDTFYVVASNPLNNVQSANALVTVGAPVPVSITGSPVSQVVASGQPVGLSATVAGSAPYTYQWNFTPPGGSTTILESNTQLSNVFSYTVPAMSAANVGAYTITLDNAAKAPVTSGAAQLTLAPPGINLAYAMPASSSSTQGACTDATTAPSLTGINCLGPENAVDGNLATRWGSATALAPPTTPTAGVDPSDLVVDLGATIPFNTVVLNWDNAAAAQYEIDYTNTPPTATTQWSVATTNKAGVGGIETLTFATAQGRYIRMHGTQRNTQYGYSLNEFQVYNLAQCGGSTERYTPSSTNLNLIADNLLNLTWTRTVKTDTAAGSQFTGVDAANYCASQSMRLPTAAEALSISGNNNAACAFPGTWATWTSTVNPADSTETAIVSFNGSKTQNVTVNYPGATLCTAGTFAGTAPIVTSAPQPATVTPGKQAIFQVVATGVPSPSFQWFENSVAIGGATEPTYITGPTTASDNGAIFSVTVSNGSGTSITTPVALTVSNSPVTPPPTPPGNPTPSPTDPGTVTTPPYSPNNPQNPAIPAGPANSGNGNTNSTDTSILGFGTGPTPTGPDLARGAKATSTGDEGGGTSAMNAIDGDQTTRWSSAFTNASDLTINLGAIKPVGQVLLRWERAYGYQYQIRVSNDGANFTPVFTQTVGQGGSENLVFPAVSAQYVQFYGIQRSSQYGYSLYEMEVYGPVGPTIVTQPASQTVAAGNAAQFTVVAEGNGPFSYQWSKNGAAIIGATSSTYTTGVLSSADTGEQYSVAVSNAGGTVTSAAAMLTVTNPTPGTANLALLKPTTSGGDENPGLGPNNATDGDLNTRWSSSFVDDNFLQVDLGAPLLINKAVLYWQNAYGKSYMIQVSNDSVNWTTVFTQTAGQGGVETVTFPAVVDRYIRMQGVTRSSIYGYSLFEFQVFGADVPSISTEPASQKVAAGTAASFSVVAGGTGPFTYQWLRNGLPIAGATSSSYTTAALVSGDSGSSFAVNVSNVNGTTASAPATVTVTSPAPAGPNLALNQPAAASSTENPNGLQASMAVDGNTTVTRWSSAEVDPSWISVDLGSAKTINQVILYWEAAYGKAYQVQVSTDAMNWTTVYTETNGAGGEENISFAPVSARYVRMYGTTRGTPYGYSLYEFQVYGPSAPLAIATQPVNQSATVGGTATFSVVAAGTGPFSYQWMKGNTLIQGATAATYTTPAVAIADNNSVFSVVVGNASGSATVTSATATLSVGAYTIYPGAIGLDLINRTGGKWADNQVYVTIIGRDPANTNLFAYINSSGQLIDFTANDRTAANHLTGPDGNAYGNYSFTLAQAKTLKLPPIGSARAYISLGAPLYTAVYANATGAITGYAGPNPQNGTDPNVNTHFDWYELNYAYNAQNGSSGIFINTTQVDEFGLPLLLDVWASNATFHQQVGITESIAQLDTEFAAQVPAAFQPASMSDLRIFSPAKLSLGANGANANYFGNVLQNAWSSYATNPLDVTLSGRQFSGTAAGQTLTFTEVNPSASHQGESFVVQLPSTQDVLGCAGAMASGVPITAAAGSTQASMQSDENAVQLQLENQICSATNRGVLLAPANWSNVASYYGTSPANFYSQFWHAHSVGGLAYGFSYDDNNNQSTTIATQNPEHMTFTVGW